MPGCEGHVAISGLKVRAVKREQGERAWGGLVGL